MEYIIGLELYTSEYLKIILHYIIKFKIIIFTINNDLSKLNIRKKLFHEL